MNEPTFLEELFDYMINNKVESVVVLPTSDGCRVNLSNGTWSTGGRDLYEWIQSDMEKNVKITTVMNRMVNYSYSDNDENGIYIKLISFG